MEKLTERVAELRRAKKRVIVVGDFNAAQTSLGRLWMQLGRKDS